MSKPGRAPAAILASRECVTPRRGGIGMKRLAARFFSVAALALAGAGTSSAADGSYGPWESTYQGPITAPAGVVCPFTVTAGAPRGKLRLPYHHHSAGQRARYE